MNPPAFQFYADDFLAGTADMTAEEVGVYIRLLCHAWTKDGLDDTDRLALLAGQCQASSLAHAKTKFSLIGGKLRNERQEKERAKQAEFRAKQAENGAKRWSGNAKPQALAMPGHMPNTCSPSPSPSPKEKKGVDYVLPFTSKEFTAAWEQWLQHRKERRQPVTETSGKLQLKKLELWGEQRAIAAIENSIAGGWQGIFEAKTELPKRGEQRQGFNSSEKYTGP